MFPYTNWLTDEKKKRDLGEAAIGQIDTGSFMMKLFLLGGFRGIVADFLWVRAEEYKNEHDWDRLRIDGRADHQAPAPLPGDLDLSGLEPGLQRLGRVGRAGGQVPVDQEGDPVRPGGGRRRTGDRPTWSGTRPGTTTTSWASRTSRSSSAGCSATTRTGSSSPITTPSAKPRSWATTTSSSGYGWFSRAVALVDQRGQPGHLGHGREHLWHRYRHPLRRPHAPAEGPARRHRFPLDAGARPDPIRRPAWRR